MISSEETYQRANELAASGMRSEAVGILEAFTNQDPNNYRAWAELSRHYLGIKDFANAEESAERALSINNKGYAAHVVKGIITKRTNLSAASEHLYTAVSLQPSASWAINELILVLVASEQYQQAIAILSLAEECRSVSQERLLFLRFYIDFVRKNILVAQEASIVEHLDSMQIFKDLLNKAKSLRPASLIRLGDGEGCFLLHNRSLHPFVRNYTISFIENAWFGQSVPALLSQKILNYLTSAIHNSDYLGIPSESRVKYEVASDPRGAIGVMQALLFSRRIDGRLCSASVNNVLEEEQNVMELFSNVPYLGTISPHAALGLNLRAKLCVDSGDDIVIPPQHDSNIFNQSACESHLDVFDSICSSIVSVVKPGRLFLVAGGLLGKCYINVIKEHGGVGMDIGAVADCWSGLKTRGHHYAEKPGLLIL